MGSREKPESFKEKVNKAIKTDLTIGNNLVKEDFITVKCEQL